VCVFWCLRTVIVTTHWTNIFLFLTSQQSPVGQGLLIIEASRSHSDTRLLLTSDRPVADLTTHNTNKRQTSMNPAVFKPTIPASERPQTHALDCAATGAGGRMFSKLNPLNAELNPICHLLALLGGATIVVVSRLGVNRQFASSTSLV
jgi:hypothetical protein